MRARELILPLLAVAFAILWVGGIASYLLLKGPPAASRWAAPAFLALGGFLTLLSAQPADRLPLLACGTLGWLAELLGAHAGIPFGPYHYTSALSPLIAGVPVVMACAWIILFAYIQQMMVGWVMPHWARTVLGASWMTTIDLVIDPLASNQLGFWRWEESGRYYHVPLSNFAGWFLVSLLLFLLFPRQMARNLWVRRTGVSLILFFTVLALGRGLALPGAIGLVLCSLHVASWISAWRNPPTRAGQSG